MRKPRDYDTELKVLDDRARRLKERRIVQLGELVIACGADALPVEQLAGMLLDAANTKDAAIKEGWRVRGAAFFLRKARSPARGGDRVGGGISTGEDGMSSAPGKASA